MEEGKLWRVARYPSSIAKSVVEFTFFPKAYWHSFPTPCLMRLVFPRTPSSSCASKLKHSQGVREEPSCPASERVMPKPLLSHFLPPCISIKRVVRFRVLYFPKFKGEGNWVLFFKVVIDKK